MTFVGFIGKWINPNGMRQTAMCPTTAQMKELSSPTPPTDTRCLNVSGNNVAGQVNRNNNGRSVQECPFHRPSLTPFSAHSCFESDAFVEGARRRSCVQSPPEKLKTVIHC